MLYDPHLDIFLKVAEAGSFSKAAAELYITPSAVIKQINLFEKDLDIRLFDRSPRGLTLTAAGVSLREDAAAAMSVCNEAVLRAREAMRKEEELIRIAVSPMTPIDPLSELLPSIMQVEPNLHYQIIPFDDREYSPEMICGNLGKTIDIVVSVLDQKRLKQLGSEGYPLYEESLGICMSPSHPLASFDCLSAEQLRGYRLMLLKEGTLGVVDQVRAFLTSGFPEVELVDVDHYSIETYNQCHTSNDLLLSVLQLNSIHPMIKIIPVENAVQAPLGIIYSAEKSPNVRRFLKAVEQVRRLKGEQK